MLKFGRKDNTENIQAAPVRKKRKFFTKRKMIFFFIILIAAGGIGYKVYKKNTEIASVPAQQIERGEIESIVSISGIVESEVSRIYYAPLNAKVAHVSVEKGDSVKKGDILLTYDTADLEYSQKEGALDMQASENSYKSAMAENSKQQKIYEESSEAYNNLEILVHAQKDFINELKNYITDEKARMRLDLIDEQYKLNRQKNGISVNMQIKPDGKITDSMYSAQYEVENKLNEINKKIEALDLNSDLSAIEKQIVKEQEKLADLEEMRNDYKVDRDSAEKSILNEYKKKELEATSLKSQVSKERADAHLNEAMEGITAEFNGIVTNLEVRDGFVTDQSSKLMTVESSDDVRVNISLSKYELEKVKVGQKAEITVAGKEYKGTVSKINHMAEKNDAGSRLVTAQVHIDNPDEDIYLGIEGRVTIHASRADNALLLPFAAVNADQKGDFCYVIKDGIVERRNIKVGITSEDFMEVLEGLQEGDVVITDISMGVTEGMQVQAQLPDSGPQE